MNDCLPVRALGRPRSELADRAILAAARTLLARDGVDGMNVETVAALAGVGKATVYRRYPCRAELVVAAAGCLAEQGAPAPDTGSVRADVQVIAHHLVTVLATAELRAIVPQVLAAAARHPDMEMAHRAFVTRRRAPLLTAIKRGIARGELRADTDAELLADLIVGPLFHRAMHLHETVDERHADAVVDAALGSFRADNAPSSPVDRSEDVCARMP